MGLQITRYFAPAVEVTDDLHPFGIGGPYGEVGAFGGTQGQGMGAQMLVQAIVIAFIEQVHVLFGKQAGPVFGQGFLFLGIVRPIR